MLSEKVTGSFVALVTPFNQDGSVDWSGFETLIDFQEANGTSAILIMGSTGESSMLTPEERKLIISKTAKMKKGNMKHFYGCAGNNTSSTIDNLKFAKAEGADGAILAAPSYICASEGDLECFFLEAADSVELPMGIYNNPPRVKSDLEHDVLLRLFSHPNYVIHKESTGRVGQVAKILKANPDVSVMCCDSPNLGLVVPTMSLGGHGTANMSGNIIPSEMVQISKPWQCEGDSKVFKEVYLKYLDVLHFNYSAINPVAVKSLMNVLGLPSGPFRKPLRPMDPGLVLSGVRIMKELGLIEKYGYGSKKIDLAS